LNISHKRRKEIKSSSPMRANAIKQLLSLKILN